MLLFALVRAIDLGEAARGVDGNTIGCTAVPWNQIIAMRNRLVHACFDIDRDILWKTAVEEIPSLWPLLKGMIDG